MCVQYKREKIVEYQPGFPRRTLSPSVRIRRNASASTTLAAALATAVRSYFRSRDAVSDANAKRTIVLNTRENSLFGRDLPRTKNIIRTIFIKKKFFFFFFTAVDSNKPTAKNGRRGTTKDANGSADDERNERARSTTGWEMIRRRTFYSPSGPLRRRRRRAIRKVRAAAADDEFYATCGAT